MKVLLTSDWHEEPFAEQKFKSQKKSLGEIIIQSLGHRGRKGVVEKIEKIIKRDRISTVIHNGDIQENEFNERGLIRKSDLDSIKAVTSSFCKRNKVKMVFNMGNHESGYSKDSTPWATDSKGGISDKSLQNFLKLSERKKVYHSFLLGEYRFCLVPYIFAEKTGRGLNLDEIKKETLSAFEEDLQKSKEKIILIIHDPDSLLDESLARVIRENKDKIVMNFYGHHHSRYFSVITRVLIRIFTWKSLILVRWLTQLGLSLVFGREVSSRAQGYYRRIKLMPDLVKELEFKLIPGPGGMLGFGRGFLVLNLDNLKVEKY